ncbi:MAG: ABC transporter ATP-binding protein/permease [Oscillospiraceae bacterium]|nr:ABC transporter ATP-binding protein/permease [Oscillospiraceae bacterium]
MKYFIDVPEPVLSCLKKQGVNTDALLYCIKSDLDCDGNYIDSYLFADKTALYTLSALSGEEKEGSGIGSYGKVSSTELEKIEDAEIVRDIYTAELYIKQNGKQSRVCRFSVGYSETFEKFKDRLLKLKKSEPIDDTVLEQMKTYCDKCKERYPDPNRPMCPNCLNKLSILKRMLKMYGGFKAQAIAFGICVVITTLLGLVAPMFSTKFLYDNVLAPNAMGSPFYKQVLLAVLLIAGTQIAALLAGVVYNILNALFTPKMLHDLRVKLFSEMQPLSLQFFTSKRTGNLMTRVIDDTDYIYGFFIDVLPSLVINAITILGIVGVLFALSPYVSLIIFSVIIVFGFVIFKFFKTQRKIWGKIFALMSRNRSYVSDVLNGQRVVKAFSKENEETGRYDSMTDSLYSHNLTARNRFANFVPKVSGSINMLFAAVFLAGGLLIIYGHMTLGSLVAFMAYARMIFNPVDYLMWFVDWWSSCVVAASRMFEILDAVPVITEIDDPVKKETLHGDIELRDVSFEYDVGRPILKKVSMNIKGGEMFGIVGKTGAGKSTIINLISRLYDVNDGEILIDGENLKNYSFDTLRRSIGVVSQETYLFIGTLTENIGYGVKEHTIDDIISAAKQAFAHDFIAKLEGGYDSVVGSGGVELSGGEKQRISIARAILQLPSILILDEATSAMDTQTERRIQYAIEKLRKDRTVIAIAHRLSTLRDADTLAVIEDGELKELGTHSELINKKGAYFKLHKLQADSLKFIEMGDEYMSGNPQNADSLYSLDDITKINYLTEDNISFVPDKNGFLSAVLNGEKFERITLNRLLPYSDAFGYISVMAKFEKNGDEKDEAETEEPEKLEELEEHEEHGKNSGNTGHTGHKRKKDGGEQEIGIIKNIDADFDPQQAQLIKRQLEFRYYCPITHKVTNIREKMSFFFIKAIFNGVEKEICVIEPTKNLRMSGLHENAVSVTDVEGNRYIIMDVYNIPKAHRQKLEIYLTI